MSNHALRPEIFHSVNNDDLDVIDRPLSAWSRIYAKGGVRKTVVLVTLALIWEVYARILDNGLLLPSFTETITALIRDVASGELPQATVYTISLLIKVPLFMPAWCGLPRPRSKTSLRSGV